MKHLQTISREWDTILNQVQACKLVSMYTIFLCAQDHNSDCIHARTFKLSMKHIQTISRGFDNLNNFKPISFCTRTLYSCVLYPYLEYLKLNQVQVCKLVCMHTIFLLYQNSISDCIHARPFKNGMKTSQDRLKGGMHTKIFKLGMKYIQTISRGLNNLTKFKHP